MHPNTKVIILRGIPSSGKTTLSKKLDEEFCAIHHDCYSPVIVCSADNYWLRPDGIYDWNPKYIGNAHKWCQSRFDFYLDTAVNEHNYKQCPHLIIVDNTNTTHKEMKPYIDMCTEYGVPFEVMIPDTPWAFDVNKCYELNKKTHNVPLEAIQRMKDRWED